VLFRGKKGVGEEEKDKNGVKRSVSLPTIKATRKKRAGMFIPARDRRREGH
jgi:hypothetical protein